jgi:hypothetical protein
MDAQLALAADPAQKTRAVVEHAERMRNLAQKAEDSQRSESGQSTRVPDAKVYLAEAELLLAQARSPRSESKPSATAPPPTGTSGKAEADPKSLTVLAKLEEQLPMQFASETPLEDVLKYIKQATGGVVPIYVDPQGLQDAERTMTSTITIDLEGIPLRRTLQLMLKQLGLVYFVDDGVLCITSADSQEPKFGPSMLEVSPFLLKQEKAERGELSVSEMKELIEIMKLQKEMEKIKNQPAGGGGIQ